MWIAVPILLRARKISPILFGSGVEKKGVGCFDDFWRVLRVMLVSFIQ